MDNEKITALAREYAEFTDTSDVEKKHISAICEYFLKFALRRYCIVDKEAIRKEYEMVKKIWEQVTLVDAKTFNEGRMSEIESLFPEIAKEVAG